MAKSSPLVKDIISVGKLTEFLQWQFSWKPPVGNSRADSSITSSPFSRWFHGTARCTCMHGHGKSRWSGVEGIPRSIRVTITLNSVCPLVHRRAGTLAKPARARCARCARFHVTIDLHASPDHRDRGALINRSRLRSHRCHFTNRPIRQFHRSPDRLYLFIIYPRLVLRANYFLFLLGRVFFYR